MGLRERINSMSYEDVSSRIGRFTLDTTIITDDSLHHLFRLKPYVIDAIKTYFTPIIDDRGTITQEMKDLYSIIYPWYTPVWPDELPDRIESVIDSFTEDAIFELIDHGVTLVQMVIQEDEPYSLWANKDIFELLKEES